MTDESNALRYMQDGGEMVPLHRDSYGSGVQEWVKVEQIESLTRDVEKYQKRAFVTTGIIDTLRAKVDELVWPQWPHMSFDPNCKLCKGDGITYYQDTSSHNPCPCGKYDPPKYTARSRGETGEKIG